MHYVLMPVETINRELDSRLFLAGRLARPGRRVLVGSARRINRVGARLGRLVYLGHSAYNTEANRDRYFEPMRAKRAGFVYLHEEGAIYPGDEQAWRDTLDFQLEYGLSHLGADDAICTWGEFQAEHFATRLPAVAARMQATGHPRFDLYKSAYRAAMQDEAQVLRERHGRFVLVNTNLSYANYQGGVEQTFIPINGYQFENHARRLWMVSCWKYSMSMLGLMVELLHRLSHALPQRKFVLRPHPSESAEFYRTVFRDVPNLVVEHSGPVGPWLLAADALIHDSCTTAVEAHLLGKPIIKPDWLSNREFEMRIPNELSRRCTSEAEVIEAVEQASEGRWTHSAEPSPLARRMLANFSQDSAAAVAEVIESVAARLRLDDEAGSDDLDVVARQESLRDGFRAFARRWRRVGAEHAKFYGLRHAAVPARLGTVAKLLGRSLALTHLDDELAVVDAG